jgi:predicted NACHT family NTPase
MLNSCWPPARFRKDRRILLLGEASLGKSTLLARLGVASCYAQLSMFVPPGKFILPVILPADNVGELLTTQDDESPSRAGTSFLLHYLATHAKHSEEHVALVKQACAKGTLLLMLDGLTATTHGKAVLAWISDVVAEHYRVRIVLSMRPTGVDHSFFTSRTFSTLQVHPLSPIQVH